MKHLKSVSLAALTAATLALPLAALAQTATAEGQTPVHHKQMRWEVLRKMRYQMRQQVRIERQKPWEPSPRRRARSNVARSAELNAAQRTEPESASAGPRKWRRCSGCAAFGCLCGTRPTRGAPARTAGGWHVAATVGAFPRRRRHRLGGPLSMVLPPP